MTGPQVPSQPGWHPDPWAPGAVRWWDGYRWTHHTSVGAVPPPQSGGGTDGFAIAALVTGVIGWFLLSIPFGFVSRSRIKNSEGRLGGSGMALAGIVIGFGWLALLALVVALGASGSFSTDNADDYSGEQKVIAVTIDNFESAADNNDGTLVCRRLLTPRYAETFSTTGQSCADYFSGLIAKNEFQEEIDIESIAISGQTARVEADEGGSRVVFDMERGRGDWRISRIDSP